MKPYRRTTLILAVILTLGPVMAAKIHAATIVAFDAHAGAFYSLTSLPDLLPAIQRGWGVKLSVVAETGDGFATGLAVSGRLQADVFGLGASAPQADGNLYRAWQGLGLSLLAGIRSPAFSLPVANIPASATLEAGGGLRATKYTGTGLVSANPAIVGQAGLDVPITEHLAVGIRVPLEFAWKSGGTAWMFGLGAAIRYR